MDLRGRPAPGLDRRVPPRDAADLLQRPDERARGRRVPGRLRRRDGQEEREEAARDADAELAAGTSLPLDAQQEERALYLVEGQIEIAGQEFAPGRLLVFRPGDRITIKAVTPARLMLLGGAALEGPRYIWWNFVSSRKERIEDAKEAWRRQRMGVVPGETELITLPDGR